MGLRCIPSVCPQVCSAGKLWGYEINPLWILESACEADWRLRRQRSGTEPVLEYQNLSNLQLWDFFIFHQLALRDFPIMSNGHHQVIGNHQNPSRVVPTHPRHDPQPLEYPKSPCPTSRFFGFWLSTTTGSPLDRSPPGGAHLSKS